MPRGSSSWKTWGATFSLSISLSRYCRHRAYRIFSIFKCVSIYSLLFSFVPISLSLSLLLMWFQAINKGPSRLLGSTVDIRIPNRLAGSGADMFHIIETQVDANSSLHYLCSPNHYLLVYSPASSHIFSSFIEPTPVDRASLYGKDAFMNLGGHFYV